MVAMADDLLLVAPSWPAYWPQEMKPLHKSSLMSEESMTI
jgi:hypothetical protein